MLSPEGLLRLQREQFHHDKCNHWDIICLPKPDRLKHYGLHFAKYVGRLARGSAEPKPQKQTLVDALLISLSAANTLHQDLASIRIETTSRPDQIDSLWVFADAAGRFADACEKLDHLEDSFSLARNANIDILHWLITTADDLQFDIVGALCKRRKELAARQFYITD
ncbi:MAG TPA: hypothetical protein VHT02_10665 [Methylocella sp.]|jgi:hypothetical protein|nr:hypothetical protein [Methylocella sp.]